MGLSLDQGQGVYSGRSEVNGNSQLCLYHTCRDIAWLLMPWQLAESGHQKMWYWLCEINHSCSSTGRVLNYLCHLSVDKWWKMWPYFYISKKFSATRGKLNLHFGCWVHWWPCEVDVLGQLTLLWWQPPAISIHIYASAIWVIIGSGNGLVPDRHQAITWTNADLLSIRP